MTLDKLIEMLEEMREEVGGDTAVRLMTQQNWPFENHIKGITSTSDMNEYLAEDAERERDEECGSVGDGEEVVFIVEGGQIAYGSKTAWECCREH